MSGKLILVIGPSGSGKSALLSYLREHMPDVIFPVSCTTRSPRPGEKNGETYFFLTDKEFDEKISNREFLEWATYGGHRYGTLASEIIPALEEGKVVIREVEVQGARQIQQLLPKKNLRIIFINAGTWEELERRILARAPIGMVELEARHNRYLDEETFKSQASIVIDNMDGKLAEAQKEFMETVQLFARQ